MNWEIFSYRNGLAKRNIDELRVLKIGKFSMYYHQYYYHISSNPFIRFVKTIVQEPMSTWRRYFSERAFQRSVIK